MLFALEKQLGIYRQRSKSFSAVIPIMTCSGPCLAPDPSLLRAYSPRLATTASDSGGPKSPMPGRQRTGDQPFRKSNAAILARCHQRWACDKHLRHAIHLFTEHSLAASGPRSTINIIAKKFQSRQCLASPRSTLAQNYLSNVDGSKTLQCELHHPNQVKHGSWVFELKTANCN